MAEGTAVDIRNAMRPRLVESVPSCLTVKRRTRAITETKHLVLGPTHVDLETRDSPEAVGDDRALGIGLRRVGEMQPGAAATAAEYRAVGRPGRRHRLSATTASMAILHAPRRRFRMMR